METRVRLFGRGRRFESAKPPISFYVNSVLHDGILDNRLHDGILDNRHLFQCYTFKPGKSAKNLAVQPSPLHTRGSKGGGGGRREKGEGRGSTCGKVYSPTCPHPCPNKPPLLPTGAKCF